MIGAIFPILIVAAIGFLALIPKGSGFSGSQFTKSRAEIKRLISKT